VTKALVIGRKRPGRPIRSAVQETARLLEAAGWKVRTSVVKKKGAVRRRSREAAKDGTLAMDTVARTFRYLDEEEVAASRKQKAAVKKGAKK